MLKKVFNKILGYKYGLLILLIVVALVFFNLGGWWHQRGIIDQSRTPPENEQERKWQEQGLLFNDGTYFVGTEIQPGIYRTTGGEANLIHGCHWQRLSGFQAETNNVIANYKETSGIPTIVEIDKDDKGFKTYGCGKWYSTTIPVTESKNTFSDGAFIVNEDIEPGTYKSNAQWGCYWERLSGFSREYYNARLFERDPELLAKSNTPVVTINAQDKGFISHNCKEWIKQTVE